VIQECGCFSASAASAPTEGDQTASSPALSRFRFLASKMKAQERAAAPAVNSTDAAVTQQARYVTDAAEAGAVDVLDFGPVGEPPTALCYHSRRTYNYILAAPAYQAYVERVFLLCGLLRLTAGRRNRISHSLKTRAFLKLNRHLC